MIFHIFPDYDVVDWEFVLAQFFFSFPLFSAMEASTYNDIWQDLEEKMIRK